MDLLSDWLSTRALRDNTRRAYQAEIERLLDFLRVRGLTWSRLSATDLHQFRRQLRAGRFHPVASQPSEGSLHQSRRIICAFLRWAAAEEHVPLTILVALTQWQQEAPERSPAPGVPRQLRLTIAALDQPQPQGRDALAVALSYWIGASPAELATLKGKAIDPAGAITMSRRGRNDTVQIPQELAAALVRMSSPSRYVFGGTLPASPAAIAQRISRWLWQHGPAGPQSSRDLRADFVARARAAGWNLEEIRMQLRRPHLSAPPMPPPPADRVALLKETASRR